tara:strand:- start:14125 stop:14379 length:255 start_codon:yes stop_codon:yes gene_type:complete
VELVGENEKWRSDSMLDAFRVAIWSGKLAGDELSASELSGGSIQMTARVLLLLQLRARFVFAASAFSGFVNVHLFHPVVLKILR